jgi:hypothetical protein
MVALLTDGQRAEIRAIADRATARPLFVSDVEGELQVWAESALTHVKRDAGGEITGWSFPSSYRSTDQVIEIDLDSWDPGEDAADDQRRQDIGDLVDARAALRPLLDRLELEQRESAHQREERIRLRDELGLLRSALADITTVLASRGEGPTGDALLGRIAGIVRRVEAAGGGDRG